MHFVDGAFLSNIKTTENPSVRGFLIEQACLTYIRHNGLLLPSPHGLLKPDRVVYFDAGAEVTARVVSPCVLYIPRPFNYRAIDAIIRVLEFGRNEAGAEVVTRVLLVPIQVTISASHKPSTASFYPRHHVWLSDIDAHVPREHVFVWLRRAPKDRVDHAEHQRGTKSQSTWSSLRRSPKSPLNSTRSLGLCISAPAHRGDSHHTNALMQRTLRSLFRYQVRSVNTRGHIDAPMAHSICCLFRFCSGDSATALPSAAPGASASAMDTSDSAGRSLSACSPDSRRLFSGLVRWL